MGEGYSPKSLLRNSTRRYYGDRSFLSPSLCSGIRSLFAPCSLDAARYRNEFLKPAILNGVGGAESVGDPRFVSSMLEILLGKLDLQTAMELQTEQIYTARNPRIESRLPCRRRRDLWGDSTIWHAEMREAGGQESELLNRAKQAG